MKQLNKLFKAKTYHQRMKVLNQFDISKEDKNKTALAAADVGNGGGCNF